MTVTRREEQAGPPPGQRTPSPYRWKATLWLVVGILLVAGAMGVFMRVIPTPFTQPSATVVPTARPTPQPAVATTLATVAPTSAPQAAPTAAPPATQSRPATVAPAAQPTKAPTDATIVALTTAAAAAPTNDVTPAPRVDPALAAEILPAYQRYWQVVDDALATLDGSNLSAVMDGPELVATQAYLNQLRSQNKAGVGPEDHSIVIVSATTEEAVIHDKVVDHSVFVDPTTREPLPPDQQAKTNTEVDGTYYLRKIDGVWKVVGEG